jgi:hypothetical protein
MEMNLTTNKTYMAMHHHHMMWVLGSVKSFV